MSSGVFDHSTYGIIRATESTDQFEDVVRLYLSISYHIELKFLAHYSVYHIPWRIDRTIHTYWNLSIAVSLKTVYQSWNLPILNYTRSTCAIYFI